MTIITHNRRRSRLSTLIDQPGGISIGVALAQARDNLATMADRSREIIDGEVQALVDLTPAASLEDTGQVLNRAYAHSSAIIDAACPFELADLCSAASNLCDVLDAAPHDAPFDWRIITVHAQSMRLLLTLGEGHEAARAQVLSSLKQVLKVKAGSTETETDQVE